MSEAVVPESLISALEALAARPVRDRSELAAWYEEARSLEKRLIAERVDVPHVVWHYLSDADIRLKDPSYGALQNQQLAQLVHELRSRGNVSGGGHGDSTGHPK